MNVFVNFLNDLFSKDFSLWLDGFGILNFCANIRLDSLDLTDADRLTTGLAKNPQYISQEISKAKVEILHAFDNIFKQMHIRDIDSDKMEVLDSQLKMINNMMNSRLDAFLLFQKQNEAKINEFRKCNLEILELIHKFKQVVYYDGFVDGVKEQTEALLAECNDVLNIKGSKSIEQTKDD